jgi:hypothetical protein
VAYRLAVAFHPLQHANSLKKLHAEGLLLEELAHIAKVGLILRLPVLPG